MQDSTHDSSALRLLARNARNTKQTLMKQQAAARKFSSMLDLVNNELPPDRGECLKLFAKRRNKKQAPTFSHNFDDSAEGSDGCAENESGAVDENSVFAALETLRREQLRQRSSSSARSTTSRPKKSALPALTRGGEGTKRPATLDMESVAAIKRLKSQGNGLGALFLLGALELKAFPEIPCTLVANLETNSWLCIYGKNQAIRLHGEAERDDAMQSIISMLCASHARNARKDERHPAAVLKVERRSVGATRKCTVEMLATRKEVVDAIKDLRKANKEARVYLSIQRFVPAAGEATFRCLWRRSRELVVQCLKSGEVGRKDMLEAVQAVVKCLETTQRCKVMELVVDVAEEAPGRWILVAIKGYKLDSKSPSKVKQPNPASATFLKSSSGPRLTKTKIRARKPKWTCAGKFCSLTADDFVCDPPSFKIAYKSIATFKADGTKVPVDAMAKRDLNRMYDLVNVCKTCFEIYSASRKRAEEEEKSEREKREQERERAKALARDRLEKERKKMKDDEKQRKKKEEESKQRKKKAIEEKRRRRQRAVPGSSGTTKTAHTNSSANTGGQRVPRVAKLAAEGVAEKAAKAKKREKEEQAKLRKKQRKEAVSAERIYSEIQRIPGEKLKKKKKFVSLRSKHEKAMRARSKSISALAPAKSTARVSRSSGSSRASKGEAEDEAGSAINPASVKKAYSEHLVEHAERSAEKKRASRAAVEVFASAHRNPFWPGHKNPYWPPKRSGGGEAAADAIDLVKTAQKVALGVGKEGTAAASSSPLDEESPAPVPYLGYEEARFDFAFCLRCSTPISICTCDAEELNAPALEAAASTPRMGVAANGGSAPEENVNGIAMTATTDTREIMRNFGYE